MKKKSFLNRLFKKKDVDLYRVSFFDHLLNENEYNKYIANISDECISLYGNSRVELLEGFYEESIYTFSRSGRFKKISKKKFYEIIRKIKESEGNDEYQFYFEEKDFFIVIGFDFIDTIFAPVHEISEDELINILPNHYHLLDKGLIVNHEYEVSKNITDNMVLKPQGKYST